MKVLSKIKKIQAKLLIQFGLVLTLSVILAGFSFYSINRLLNYTGMRKATQDLNMLTLQLRRSEKDFLLRDLINEKFFDKGESANVDKNHELSVEALKKIEDLQANALTGEFGFHDSLNVVRDYFQEYARLFDEVANVYKKRGFKNWGQEGELRKAIHSVESSDLPYDKVLMLTLRRHEKDFMLRKDLNYVKQFDLTLDEFKASLEKSKESAALVKDVIHYGEEFHNLVEQESKLGFNDAEGLKGNLRTVIHKIEPLVESMGAKAVAHVQTVKTNTILMLAILFIVQLVLGVALALSFSKTMTADIQVIKDRIEKLSEGVFPSKAEIQSHDEVGVTSRALNNLIDRIKTAADFAGRIGNGELNVSYDSSFNNDVLAQSLQTMHQKLKDAAVENEKRNWATTGLANFSEILRSENLDLAQLGDRIIGNLVKYLQANQGQLYVVQEENNSEYLELISTYAWDKKKFISRKITKGDGLAGQAWIEKSTLYLVEIPSDYIRITSGLGEANPGSILIVPLKVNDQVFGVIEIASFKKFEKYHIEFVEKLSEVIASTLSGVKINSRTQTLLAESQHQAEELRAQEEEMRQNQEEMQATQEELGRQRVEMQEEIRKLHEQLSIYKKREPNHKEMNGVTAETI